MGYPQAMAAAERSMGNAMAKRESTGVRDLTRKLYVVFLLLLALVVAALVVVIYISGPPEEFPQKLLETTALAALTVWVSMILTRWLGLSAEMREATEMISDLRLGASAKQLGVTDVYQKREDAKDDIIRDIEQSRFSCRTYAAVYLTELHKDEAYFTAIARAARSASGRKYLVSYTSLNPGGGGADAVLRQVWARREGDDSVDPLEQRIKTGHARFHSAMLPIQQDRETPADVRRRFTRNHTFTHSLLVIDNVIAYVGFYDRVNARGNMAPALRLQGSGPWARNFLLEADNIDSKWSIAAASAIAFDFDGVIAHSMPLQERSWKAAVDSIAATRRKALWPLLERNLYEGRAGPAMFTGLEVDAELMGALRKEKDRLWAECRSEVPLMDGVGAVLADLKHSGVKLAIATTADKSYVMDTLDKGNLAGMFDVILTDADVAHPKPAPDLLNQISERLDIQKANLYMVGDTNMDGVMAQAAKCIFVRFTSHRKVPPVAHATELATVGSWSELSGLLLGAQTT
jgi:AHBA synthesis associated protein